MGQNLEDLFPELVASGRELYDAFTLIAMVVLFVGLVIAAARGTLGGVHDLIRVIGSLAIQVVAIASFPDWVDQVQAIGYQVIDYLDADPSEAHQRFADVLVGESENGEEAGFWDVLWSDSGGIGKALIFAVVLLVGKVAWLITWLGYLIQQIVLIFGTATAPLFISMLVLNATRGIAIRFFMSLIGVTSWPLGWAIANMMTDALLNMAATDRLYVEDGNQIVFGTQTLFFILLVSIWILVSTIATPRLISGMIQNGSQIGVSVLSSLGMGASRGLSFGVGAGVTASVAGASPVGSAAAAAIGGTGGIISGATGGSGALGSAAIGALAIAGLGASSPQEINDRASSIASKNTK